MTGRAQSWNVRVLQIADAAMDHLETFGRSAAAEITAFHQGRAQTTQCGVTSGCRTERPAADDEQVIFTPGQSSSTALHLLPVSRCSSTTLAMHFQCRNAPAIFPTAIDSFFLQDVADGVQVIGLRKLRQGRARVQGFADVIVATELVTFPVPGPKAGLDRPWQGHGARQGAGALNK
jgi:hypothetical protein